MPATTLETSAVLDAADIEHFLTHGFVHLTDCFDTTPGSLAHRWVNETWIRNDLPADDPSKWPLGKIHMPTLERLPVRDVSPKAFAAICQLCGGEDRIAPDQVWGNHMIVNYGWGRDKEWVPPGRAATGWHVDGDHFLHFLDSAEQGLLVVVLWADIHPRGGGTFIACDSIAPVARFLAARPEGVPPNAFPPKGALALECHDFRETTGKAGDVYLLHPFTLHTSSYNHRPEARFMTNPPVALREPMRLDRRGDGSAYSLVEQGILRALGVEHLEFKPTSERQRIVPPRKATEHEVLERERQRLAAVGA